MTTIADNPLACPMSTVAAVTVENIIKHQDTIGDRRIQVVLDCSCRYELSLPLTTPAPRVGEPSYCRGRHDT